MFCGEAPNMARLTHHPPGWWAPWFRRERNCT